MAQNAKVSDFGKSVHFREKCPFSGKVSDFGKSGGFVRVSFDSRSTLVRRLSGSFWVGIVFAKRKSNET